ncbi:condensation domain-containing protein [Streptomyces sp. CC224B]|uniref:condensation domain-containing protein n=1 Tax=Streptomyces sp. CC224B TaxID=3044571 RepID=UPI0024A8F46A|nr:condensation domain-containing protein [Streptomyces sp. CC224B]
MRMTDLQRCELRPGRLVEWTLHPAAVGAAHALPDDARPPAYVQESHLRTARWVRRGGLHVPSWLGTVFDLPGPVDLDALHTALRDWTRRHETLRSGFRWRGDEVRRFTLDAASVALRRTEVGRFRETAALSRYLQDRFDTVADALTWPNFIFTAIVRADGATLCMAFDHSNVDSYSIQRIPAEIHELYAAALQGRTVPVAPVASYVDFCASERTDADRADPTHPVVARWREFIGRCGGRLPGFPVDLGLGPAAPAALPGLSHPSAGPAPGDPSPTDPASASGPWPRPRLPAQKLLHEMVADDADAAAFEAYCRPHGGSLVGVLAAVALITRELSGLRVYRTVVPFHTRVRSRWADSMGWYVGGAPIEVPVGQAAGFDDALRMVRAALREARPLARMPVARVLPLLGADFRPTSPDLYSIVSYVDARAVAGSERWQEQKAYGLIRVSYGDQVCAWVTRLHEGLQFACRYPDTPVAYANMRLVVERLRERVVETARAAAATTQGVRV